ncbi:hypothetical protein ACE5IS_19355, partial [Leptospira wolffii]|uniref:hypothetical protein n=1 Tax=Leptospira wolffii TaxID=409998 RepID=UPI0035CD0CA1
MTNAVLKTEKELKIGISNETYRKSETWSELGISVRSNPNKPSKYLTLITEESRGEENKKPERNPKNLRKHLSSI